MGEIHHSSSFARLSAALLAAALGTLVFSSVAIADVLPSAVDDNPIVREDSGETEIRVRQNDVNPDGSGPFTVDSVADPAHGTTSIFEARQVIYAPDPGYCNDGAPADTFTYTLNGGSTATVSVAVTCVDDLPVAVDDSFEVQEDPASPVVLRVRLNDTDVDGGRKEIVANTAPANGTAMISPGGESMLYTPNPEFCGLTPEPDDSFIYTLNGGSTATVSINVKCGRDAPVATDDAFTGVGNTGLFVGTTRPAAEAGHEDHRVGSRQRHRHRHAADAPARRRRDEADLAAAARSRSRATATSPSGPTTATPPTRSPTRVTDGSADVDRHRRRSRSAARSGTSRTTPRPAATAPPTGRSTRSPRPRRRPAAATPRTSSTATTRRSASAPAT